MSIGRCLRGVALAVLAASATGCDKQDAPAEPGEWPDDGRWWSDADEAGGGGGGSGGIGEGPGDGDGDGEDEEEVIAKLAAGVTRIFGAHCAPCHAGRRGVVFGDFGDIYAVEEMIGRGFVVPFNLESSRLLQLVLNDAMPPTPFGAVLDPSDPTSVIAKVSAEDKALLSRWITAGAPPLRDGYGAENFTLPGALFRGILLDDLERVPPAERTNYRYISLYDAATTSYVQPEFVASAVSLALNRLSTSPGAVVVPATVLGPGDRLLALRVDLRAYGLDAADWARLEAATELVDRQAFPCDVPFLDANAFLQLALADEFLRTDGTLESIYSNITLRRVLQKAGVLAPGQPVFEPAPAGKGAPTPLTSTVTLPQLAGALGVDLAGNLALGGAPATRACFRTSSETAGARCVQRDAMPGGVSRGFWWTMDIAPELAFNPVDDPIGPGNGGLAPAPAGTGFDLSEGMAFWPWPNATPGFAVFDDQLRLRSSRPSTATIELPSGGDGDFSARGINARSCTSFCHSARLIPVADEMRSLVENGTQYGANELAFVEPLLRTQGEIEAQMAIEEVFYAQALRASCVKRCFTIGRYEIDTSYLPFYTLYPANVWNAFFLDEPSLKLLIESDPELPTAFLSPQNISREVFVKGFDAVRRAAIKAGGDEATLQLCVQPASND